MDYVVSKIVNNKNVEECFEYFYKNDITIEKLSIIDSFNNKTIMYLYNTAFLGYEKYMTKENKNKYTLIKQYIVIIKIFLKSEYKKNDVYINYNSELFIKEVDSEKLIKVFNINDLLGYELLVEGSCSNIYIKDKITCIILFNYKKIKNFVKDFESGENVELYYLYTLNTSYTEITSSEFLFNNELHNDVLNKINIKNEKYIKLFKELDFIEHVRFLTYRKILINIILDFKNDYQNGEYYSDTTKDITPVLNNLNTDIIISILNIEIKEEYDFKLINTRLDEVYKTIFKHSRLQDT